MHITLHVCSILLSAYSQSFFCFPLVAVTMLTQLALLQVVQIGIEQHTTTCIMKEKGCLFL